MELESLKNKALSLPYAPGVYIMKNAAGEVIYVGKAKKLKNRVSQYFYDTASHNIKTRLMVSNVYDFDVIVADSEFEALVLECSLIKRHQPKYNILLKDDKGYPYIRLNSKDSYPKLSMVSKPANDNASYYGPFGSRGVTQALLEEIRIALKLPGCNKKFPRDIGKSRVCLQYHMNQCNGWCQVGHSESQYRKVIDQAKRLLTGNYKSVTDDLKEQMLTAANDLNFELAASLRDRITAIDALSKRQIVTAGSPTDTDVIGYAQTEVKACFAVLHYAGGNLLDKDYQILSIPDDAEAALSTLIKQYYLSRGFAPRQILLPFGVDDSALFEQLLLQQFQSKTTFEVPQRGVKARLVELAVKNAKEEAERTSAKEERVSATVAMLAKMLGLDQLKRIESFDISNLSGTDIVASMVVFVDGKARKSDYKRFKLEGLQTQDDYASMAQVVQRRFQHYLNGDKGFDILPDLLLIDGGVTHARTAQQVLSSLNISTLVLGMVKDDRHRTRALVTPEGEQISIINQQSVFSFIGTIQEETHRFAITYHKKLRSKRLRYSELDTIPGIGPTRKQLLLNVFKSITAISEADIPTLNRYLPMDAATSVYEHFKKKRGGKESCVSSPEQQEEKT